LRISQASAIRLGSRSSTASPAEAATELRLELTRGGAFSLLALITATVTIAVTATSATTATTPLAVVTTEHTPGRSRALLLDVCLGHNLGGQVEPLAKVVETLRGESVVVVLPGETGLQVAAGGQ